MTAIGMTGHQGLTPDTEILVARAIADELRGVRDLVGITSLAEGADQIFAEHVLAAGGQFVVILPAADYIRTFSDNSARERYRRLLDSAIQVVHLPFATSSEDAYWAAGREVVNRSDLLLAVWNGKPAGGLGGTADVVAYAREHGRPTVVIWPPGARRIENAVHPHDSPSLG
jgi:hypothetical protein